MKYILLVLFIFLMSCQNDSPLDFFTQVNQLEKIDSQSEYIDSPFLSAGKRLYVVGHQNGTFPDLGWHVEGEMGGVWLHPIKLLDGYHAEIKSDNNQLCLTQADDFINYPIGSEQIFNVEEAGIKVSQFHFVPENENGLIVAYQIENTLSKKNNFQFTVHASIDLRPVWLADSLAIEDGEDKGDWKQGNGLFIAKDQKNDWFTALGERDLNVLRKKTLVKGRERETVLIKA